MKGAEEELATRQITVENIDDLYGILKLRSAKNELENGTKGDQEPYFCPNSSTRVTKFSTIAMCTVRWIKILNLKMSLFVDY